ncbi:acyltransferase family protein [Alkaliflexus imshenetskii]|uniref:acyltransferase family protein n=1 Tax=Alkaliflexus imshenetskii TaxID=286730 RepID=UPI00047C91A0|nr:acyltransferase [Alkaliflexus imshenetskii]
MEISKADTNTPKTERLYWPELDGVRFFAFLLVFIHHHPLFKDVPGLKYIYEYGWIGVDLFFVLSAYLFTKLLVVEYQKTNTISFKKFYIRRVFRIWPVYYVFVAIVVLLALYAKDFEVSRYMWIRIAGLLTFADNILTANAGYNPIEITSHLWTIGYEEQFYVFIPLIIFFLVRKPIKVRWLFFISVYLLCSIIRLIIIVKQVPHPALWVLPITHFEAIFMGVIIGFGGADFILKKIKPEIVGVIGLLFFVLIILMPNLDIISGWLILTYTFVGFSTALVFYAVLYSPPLQRFFSKELFVFLGKRSYGLYVFHLAANSLAFMIVKKAGFSDPNVLWISFIVSLLLTILMSVISYQFIERPFLILKKKFEIVVSRPV